MTAIAAGLTFRRAITPWSTLPDSDYWGNISGLITESGVRLTIANLFRHNNEHIVVIPKLIYAANYLATSGSNTGLIVYSLAVGIACTALLLVLARELLLDTPWRLLLCALLFPLAMFSAKLTHSYFLGMSGTIWLTADLFVIVSAAALARAVASESAPWLLVSLFAGVLGVLAYSTAIYMLIVLVIFCVAKLLRAQLPGPGSRPLLLGTAAAALFVLGFGAAFRNAPKAKPDLAFNLVGLVEFVLIYLGNALTTGPLRLVAGLVILAAGAASIWRLAAEQRLKETFLWVILFFFAPFNALMTGIARLGYGVKIAATSRYQSVTAITLIATIVLVLAALPKSASSRRDVVWRNVTFGVLLVCAALIALDRSYVVNYTARNERKAVAEIALRQGIEGNQHLKSVTPASNQLKRSMQMLRAARHAPFHWRSRCEEALGQHIAAPARSAAGRIETISAYKMSRGDGRALELSGWAERDGVAAECIILVDGTDTAIGAAALVTRRPDVEQAAARYLGLVGWRGVAAVPASSPVCAFALFPRESEPAPLTDCQAVPEGAGAP
ncbi:hypothetical protein [Methyloceanibacter sp.]|uniref:hypothetical protein n=1 Tax=Methyloceanibacter sp. TaxID=1965321 RepID=UPI003D6C976F